MRCRARQRAARRARRAHRGEHLLDLESRPKVGRQFGRREHGHQTRQIDHSLHTRAGCCFRECLRSQAIEPFKIRISQSVDQVVRRRHTLHCCVDGSRVENVHLDGLERTHDLIVDLLETLGRSVTEVRITGLQEGTFFADLVLDGDQTVSARPSDSVAMAVRLEVPIFAEEEVLAEAGLLLPDEEIDTEASESAEEPPADEEVEAFKEFLDSISADDFKAPGDS